MTRDKHHQQQDHHRNERQCAVVEYLARDVRFALLPVAQFDTVFHADLVEMLEIVCKFACACA